MDIGKLLRDAKRRGKVNINVKAPRNVKVVRNVAGGGRVSHAEARQDVRIEQHGGHEGPDAGGDRDD